MCMISCSDIKIIFELKTTNIRNNLDIVKPFRMHLYSVMQSDRNSFCGNVVLNSDIMAFGENTFFLPNIWKPNMFEFLLCSLDFF